MGHLKLISGLVVAALVLSFFLFRPVFTQFLGWKSWPHLEKPQSQTIVSEEKSDHWKDVDALLDELYKSGRYPSLSVAVWKNGKVEWSKVIGYANLDKKLPADSNTQYRIGSSSKAVNATLAAALVDQKSLDLDAPISDYIRYFGEKEYPVTTRQLLSHTAGIRHYGTCWCLPIWDYENTRRFDRVEDAVATFSDSDLLFEPGTNFSYSSYGIVLSSGVLENAGKAAYLNLIESRITSPLGLNGLMPDELELENDRRAVFYDVYDNNYKKSEFIDSSIKWAGGGFVASPTDLAKLGGAWLEDTLVSSNTRRIFWTPQKLSNGKVNPQSYALGWRSETKDIRFDEDRPTKIVHHNGVARGSSSNFVLFPEYGLAISVMTNRSTLQGDDPFRAIATQIGQTLIEAEETETNK